MRWRTVRRSRRSEVKWVATGCSRRRTTPVVGWSNGTLSDAHSRGGFKSGDDEAEDQARFPSPARQEGQIKHAETDKELDILYRISRKQNKKERPTESRTVTVVRYPIGER